MVDEDEEETPGMVTKDPPSEELKDKLIVEKLPSIPDQPQEILSMEGLPSNPVESRDNLVHTAVSFLQNPKVRDGPVTQKKAFLRKKGLTEEEISDAFIRSGTVEHVPQPMSHYPLSPPPVVHIPVVSSWMRIRETMVAGIFVWGLSKAAHKLYTEYVSPYFDLRRPQERRLEVIENSVLEMQNNLVETMQKVQEVVSTVQQQQKQMLVLTEQLLKNMPQSSNSITLHQNDQATNEIKSELNSIKGILLSRKQFPTVPNTNTSLPTWQLNTSAPAATAELAAAIPVNEATATPGEIVAITPGEIVAATPGEVVASTPGEVVASTPGEVVASTPGEVVASTPAEVVASTPAEVVASTPAEVVAATPAEVVAATHDEDAVAATPETLEPESMVSNIPNELDMLPPPSNQTSNDVEETSNTERVISIEDNLEVDNPNPVIKNGESNKQQEADSKHGSKKSRTKKEDTKKKNNNVNELSTDQTSKLDKSHVI